MAWTLNPALITLREQLNALYPNRSKASDGTIGDAAHTSTTSDHNPSRTGKVNAFDITHDPKNGVDGNTLAELLNDDPRVTYVIWNRKIWDRRWIPYNGPNPHSRHVHVSVRDNANKGLWNLKGADMPERIVIEADRVNFNKALFGQDRGLWREVVGRNFQDAWNLILGSPALRDEIPVKINNLNSQVNELTRALTLHQAANGELTKWLAVKQILKQITPFIN